MSTQHGIIIFSICLIFGGAAYTYITHEKVKRNKRLTEWESERVRYFRYMDWFEVPGHVSFEAYDKIKTYEELIEVNNAMEKEINKRTNKELI